MPGEMKAVSLFTIHSFKNKTNCLSPVSKEFRHRRGKRLERILVWAH